MTKRKKALLTAVAATATLAMTGAHAAPNFGSSGFSLSSDASRTVKSERTTLTEWVLERLLFTIDFDSQLRGDEASTVTSDHGVSSADECEEQKNQTAAAPSEGEATAKSSPTGPEPLYLAF